MKFRFTQKFQKNTALIFPFFTEKKKPVPSSWAAIDKLCQNQHQEGHFEGKEGEIFVRYPDESNKGKGILPSRIVFTCMGEKKKLKATKILIHFAAALKKVKTEKGNNTSIAIPEDLAKFGETLGEALVLANYNPAKYKTGTALKKLKEHDITTCFFQTKKFSKTETEYFTKQLERGRLLAEATNTVREWVNGPPNIVTPEFMEEQAIKLAKTNGYKVTIFRKKALEKMGMGGIIAVNSGSSKEARLLVLEYWPGNGLTDISKGKPRPIVLVGKGIIFDSGGYNLKPTGYIENMHLDMSGAAAVIGVFQLLKKFKIPVPVVALTPITDNAIDANATKPSTIIKMFGGKSVEITNTDAEGRLVLGDTVGYAAKTYKPRYIIDLATLTGACMVALGERYAGLFDNDKELRQLIQKASRATDELVWPMPLHKEFSEAMRGELTDLRNSEDGHYAGASKGAAFIKAFVGKTKWAHIDIAGPAYTTHPKKYETKRATGYGVRLLMKFLENLKQM